MTRGDKLHLIATGSQAPYLIGETIAVFPLSHRRKVQAELDQYYNKPDIELHRQGEHLLTIKGSVFSEFMLGRTSACYPAVGKDGKIFKFNPDNC